MMTQLKGGQTFWTAKKVTLILNIWELLLVHPPLRSPIGIPLFRKYNTS